MAVLLKMPLNTYRCFLGRFPLPSRGYVILKNSVIERTRDSSIVEMLCQIEDAKLILDRAYQFYPRAAPYIEDALSVISEHAQTKAFLHLENPVQVTASVARKPE